MRNNTCWRDIGKRYYFGNRYDVTILNRKIFVVHKKMPQGDPRMKFSLAAATMAIAFALAGAPATAEAGDLHRLCPTHWVKHVLHHHHAKKAVVVKKVAKKPAKKVVVKKAAKKPLK
jgi:hypothetical protein